MRKLQIGDDANEFFRKDRVFFVSFKCGLIPLIFDVRNVLQDIIKIAKFFDQILCPFRPNSSDTRYVV